MRLRIEATAVSISNSVLHARRRVTVIRIREGYASVMAQRLAVGILDVALHLCPFAKERPDLETALFWGAAIMHTDVLKGFLRCLAAIFAQTSDVLLGALAVDCFRVLASVGDLVVVAPADASSPGH